MKKIFQKLKFWLIIFLCIPLQINATSGYIKSNSIVECNGKHYGTHGSDNHWHEAEYYSSDSRWHAIGDPLTGNPCAGGTYQSNSDPSTSNNTNSSSTNDYIVTNQTTTQQTESSINSAQDNNATIESSIGTKSNDVTIKSIIIDNQEIEINDTMEYITNNSKINIQVILNDDKSTVNISDNYKKLSIGNNEIKITVTAEDSTEKDYILSIYRKSNNTNITLKYQDKIIKFNNYISDTIYADEYEIKFDITVEDKKTTTDIKDSYKIEDGDNQIIINITAENESVQQYTVKIHKNTTLENIIAYIIIILMFVLPITTIYKFIKIKNKKYRITLILCVLFGAFGIHHFYNKNIKRGILYLCTFGIFGIGCCIDWILILLNKFKIK